MKTQLIITALKFNQIVLPIVLWGHLHTSISADAAPPTWNPLSFPCLHLYWPSNTLPSLKNIVQAPPSLRSLCLSDVVVSSFNLVTTFCGYHSSFTYLILSIFIQTSWMSLIPHISLQDSWEQWLLCLSLLPSWVPWIQMASMLYENFQFYWIEMEHSVSP